MITEHKENTSKTFEWGEPVVGDVLALISSFLDKSPEYSKKWTDASPYYSGYEWSDERIEKRIVRIKVEKKLGYIWNILAEAES